MKSLIPSRAFRRRIEALARADARAELPDVFDGELSPGERQIVHEGRQDLATVRGAYTAEDAPLAARFAEARRDYRDIDRRYRTKLAEVGDRPDMTTTKWWYAGTAALILAGEVPINLQVFDAFMRDAYVLNMLVCIVVSLLLALSAHHIGKSFRQNRNRPTAMSAALIVAFTGSILIIANMRGQFAEKLPPLEGLEYLRVDNANVIVGLFVFINLLFLLVGAAASWNHYDPDPEYHQLSKRHRRLRKLAYAVKGERDQLAARWHAQSMRALNFAGTTIQMYRAANLKARMKKAVPQAWLDHPVENLFAEDVHALAPAANNEIWEVGEPDAPPGQGVATLVTVADD